MTQDGFLAPEPPRPLRLGIIIAAHAAVIGAVMFAKGPQFVPRIADPLIAHTYHEDTPPPPHTSPPPPKAQPHDERIAKVDRLVDVPATTTAEEVTVLNLPPFTPPSGSGPTIVPPPQPLPPVAPVLVDAAFDPRFADALQPPYPPALMRQEVQGDAKVRVLIGTDGRVRDVQLVSADDPRFFEATARQARRAWRFRPATRDGVPVESWRTMTVHFLIR